MQQAPTSDVFSMLAGSASAISKIADKKVESLAGHKPGENLATLKDLITQSEAKLEGATSRTTFTEEELTGIRSEILLADLESARATIDTDRADLAGALEGLNDFLISIGAEVYTNFGKETPEEIAVIKTAEDRLATADANQRKAESNLAVANTKMVLFGIRKRSVASATSRLEEANAELEAARLGVPEAQARAKSMARKRLQDANIDELLQEYTGKSERLVGIMMQRREDSRVEEEFVSNRRAIADSTREVAIKHLESSTQEVSNLETQVSGLQSEIGLIQSGTPEYAAKETQIRETNALLEEARNRRNVALAVSDSKTRYAEELSLHVTALTRLRGNLETWIASLQSATEERVATFRAVLQQQKMLDDQEVAARIDEAGAEIDKRNAKSAAAAVVATDRARQQMFASLPERGKAIAGIMEALATHVNSTEGIDAEFVEQFRRRYGITTPVN